MAAYRPRTSRTRNHRDPGSSRSPELIEPHGGLIVAEYFDIGHSRSLPWKRRPEASLLLEPSGTRTADSMAS